MYPCRLSLHARVQLAALACSLACLVLSVKVLNGDGAMDGHVAMRAVLRAYTAAGRRDKPVMFNLTGNVIDSDKEKYLAAGSCGVLAKPTKLSDMTDKIQACLDS